MRLQVLKNCRADGRHFSIGEVTDLPDGIAKELLAMGMASLAPEPEPAPVIEPKPRRKNSTTSLKEG